MRKPPFVTAVSEAKVADVGASAAEQLLDQTLVLLPTEFGRTPRTNDNDGRDHRNEAFMCLLAGAGIERGARTATKDADMLSSRMGGAGLATA